MVHGDGEQGRDFLHVADVTLATLAAADSDRAIGQAIKIGPGRAVSVGELAETVVDVADSDSEIARTEPLTADIQRRQAEGRRAESVLDFEAAVPIESGLEDVVPGDRRRDG